MTTNDPTSRRLDPHDDLAEGHGDPHEHLMGPAPHGAVPPRGWLRRDLLVLVEAPDLGRPELRSLVARLEDDPAARRFVEARRRDRAAMRRLAEHDRRSPAPRRDLVARAVARSEVRPVEPVVATISIGDAGGVVAEHPRDRRPGAYRRLHDRPRRLRQRLRIAASTVVGLTATAALIAFAATLDLTALVGSGDRDAERLAERGVGGSESGSESGSETGSEAGYETDRPAGDRADRTPRRRWSDGLVARRGGGADVDEAAPSGPPPRRIADARLVIRTDDPAFAADRLAAMLDDRAADDAAIVPMSLVRNFSLDEARHLQRVLMLDRADHPRGEPRRPILADVDPSAVQVGAGDLDRIDRALSSAAGALDELRAAGRATLDDSGRPTSGLLAGDGRTAPSLAEQLAISNDGATLTIGVRADRLLDLLERLHAASDPTSDDAAPAATFDLALEAGASGDGEAPGGSNGRWRRSRDAAERLLEIEPDAIVLLPVVIEPAGPGGTGGAPPAVR